MTEPAQKKQRVRSKNFSLQEVEVLKNEVKANINLIQAKHCNGSSGVTKKDQDKVWLLIAEKVNALGVCLRTVSELKEKWRNLTKQAKTEVAAQNAAMAKTGGGPLPEKYIVNPVIADVAELFSNSASFHGIPGAMDAETILLSFSDLTQEDFPSNHTALEEVEVQGGQAYNGSLSENNNTSTEMDTVVPDLETSSDVAKDSTKKQATSNSTSSRHSGQNIPQKKEEKKTLKELQTDFYIAAIKNKQQQSLLLKEQLEMCVLQKETLRKINSAVDVLLENFVAKIDK